MRWSQLKKRIEATFAESVAGRVEVWTTRYRKSADEEGEAWITIDKHRVASMGMGTYFVESGRETIRIQQDSGSTDLNPDHRDGCYLPLEEADMIVHARGVFAPGCLTWRCSTILIFQ